MFHWNARKTIKHMWIVSFQIIHQNNGCILVFILVLIEILHKFGDMSQFTNKVVLEQSAQFKGCGLEWGPRSHDAPNLLQRIFIIGPSLDFHFYINLIDEALHSKQYNNTSNKPENYCHKKKWIHLDRIPPQTKFVHHRHIQGARDKIHSLRG